MKYSYKKISNFSTRIYEFNNLYNKVFSCNRSISKTKWEFEENPIPFHKNFFLLNDENEILGHWGIIPHYLVIDNKILKAGKIENTMIASSLQGKGLFKPFENHCSNNLISEGFLLWSISSQSAIRLRQKLGYTISGNFKTYQQSLLCKEKLSLKRISYIILFFIKELYKPTIAIRNLYKRLTKINYLLDPKARINLVLFEDLEKMLIKIKQYKVNTIHREPNYMEWRFNSNPNIDYSYYQSVDGKFYAITATKSDSVIFVHDMGYIDNGYFRIPPQRYLSSLEIYFAEEGKKKLQIKTLHNSFFAKQLLDEGYFISKQMLESQFGTMVYTGFRNKINLKEWYFTNIFSEGIR